MTMRLVPFLAAHPLATHRLAVDEEARVVGDLIFTGLRRRLAAPAQ